MERERRGREGREGNGSMHPLGFSKVGAYELSRVNFVSNIYFCIYGVIKLRRRDYNQV